MTSAFGTARPSTAGPCPCGGFPVPGSAYVDCCGRYHAGSAAPTAEALMRSRYAAFAMGDEAYLLRTWHPRTRPERLQLDPHHAWTGLTILATTAGGPHDPTATVTYRATSRDRQGGPHELRETSRFARRGARWMYVDGDVDAAST